MVRGKILQIFLADTDSEEYSRFSLSEKKESSNSCGQYKSHLKSKIKINITSNETMDVFGLHGQY